MRSRPDPAPERERALEADRQGLQAIDEPGLGQLRLAGRLPQADEPGRGAGAPTISGSPGAA